MKARHIRRGEERGCHADDVDDGSALHERVLDLFINARASQDNRDAAIRGQAPHQLKTSRVHARFDVRGQPFTLAGLNSFMMNGCAALGVDTFVILWDRSFVRQKDARG